MKPASRTRSLFFRAAVALAACLVMHPPVATGDASPGRILLPPAAPGHETIKILLYFDMEGTTGQNSVRTVDYGTEEYAQAREALTADVNAVIAGLAAGGADSIVVVDAHGSGNPEPDILLDRLDPRARMISKGSRFDAYRDLVAEGACDAIAGVAMHARTGSGGFAEHTINIGMEWILNDMAISEAEIYAYSWGTSRIPLIFVSGDDRLKEQLSWMSWLEYVTVKKARGTGDADLRPPADVHEEMRAKAESAVRGLPRSKAVRLTEPIKAQLRAVWPASLGSLEGVPGVDYDDQTVAFTAADFPEAYRAMRALMGIAQYGYLEILVELAMRENDGAMYKAAKDKVFSVWTAGPPSETLAPAPPAPTAPPASAKRYFGYK